MFYIVIYHILIHTSVFDISGGAYKALTTISHIGVPVFVMISGYFGIHRKAYGVFKLLAQVMFYNIVCFIIAHFALDTPLSLDAIMQIILPLSHGGYWFVSLYVVLYLLAPYINTVLNSLDKKQIIRLLLLLSFILFYLGGIHDLGFAQERSIFTFLMAYSLGNYIRRFSSELLNRIKILSSFIPYIIVVVLFLSTMIIIKPEYGRIMNHLVFPYNSMGIFLMSVLFFIGFTSLHIRSKLINYCSSSVFAIYLIHENKFIRDAFFYRYFQEWSALIPHYMSFLYLLVYAVVSIALFIIIDKARCSLFNILKIDIAIKALSETKIFRHLNAYTIDNKIND